MRLWLRVAWFAWRYTAAEVSCERVLEPVGNTAKEPLVAEQKTTPTKASVDAYIASASTDERRADCRALIALFRKATNEPPVMWGPSIVGFGSCHSKHASGHGGDACLVGFSSRKR